MLQLEIFGYADNQAPSMDKKVSANTSSDHSQYTTDWRYWSQGASQYTNRNGSNSSGMRKAGCRVVSQAKLLVEAGIAPNDVNIFNPDTLFVWGNAHGYLGTKGDLWANVGEQKGVGCTMLAYAEASGVNLVKGSLSLSNYSYAEKDALIMEYLNNGYYVIIGGAGHHAYVGREESLSCGSPIIWDSGKKWSYSPDHRRTGTANASKYNTSVSDNLYYYSIGDLPTNHNPATILYDPVTPTSSTSTSAEEYIRQCTSESCAVAITVTTAGSMKNMPCSVSTNAQSTTVEELKTGNTYYSTRRWTNTVGNTWYEVSSNGKRGFVYSGDVSVSDVPSSEASSTLSVSGNGSGTPSGTMKKGSRFGLRGEIKSNYIITYIEAHVYDSSGHDALSPYKTTWSKKTYNIKKDGINDAFSFGKLPSNKDNEYYRYYVAAADESAPNVMRTLIDSKFRVTDDGKDNRETVTENTGTTLEFTITTPELYAPNKMDPEPVSTYETPEITVSEYNTPPDLTKGSRFGIRGIVQTNIGSITDIWAYIYGADGNSPVQSAHVTPNEKTHDLRYSINDCLIFGTLPSGSYRYIVEAAAKNGDQTTSKRIIDSSFQVLGADGQPVQQQPSTPVQETKPSTQPATTYDQPSEISSGEATYSIPRLSIQGASYPGDIVIGQNFDIYGTVSTDVGSLAEVTAYVLKSNGDWAAYSSFAPSTTSYDLHGAINNNINFSTLSEGWYVYRVIATAVNGSQSSTETLVDCSFQVKSASSQSEQTFVSYDQELVVSTDAHGTTDTPSQIVTPDKPPVYERAPIPGYRLATKLNINYVLDIASEGTDNGDNLQLGRNNYSDSQGFDLTTVEGGFYRITNCNSGLDLTAENGGASGSNVCQCSYDGSDTQLWSFVENNDGSYFIVNKASGCYLDVDNAYAAEGTNVKVFDRNDGYDAQKWYVQDVFLE